MPGCVMATKVPLFYSTDNAAKTLGVGRRTIARIAEDHQIAPLRFGGAQHVRHFWTREHLVEIKRHLKGAKREWVN